MGICLPACPSRGPEPRAKAVAKRLECVATDPDLPPQVLTYSLLDSPPPSAGAATNSHSGVFTWRPAVAQANTTNRITAVVADSGSPSLGATQSFTVTVRPITPVRVIAKTATNGLFQLTVTGGDIGLDYTVQASVDVATWTTVATSNSPPLPFLWTDPSAIHRAWRFYRVLPGP